MSDGRALLEAFESGDDTARLAYADLLEERGDERAAWVRDLVVWRWMAPDAHDPVPGLIEALRDESSARHRSAQAALAKVGAPAVPALLELLQAASGDVTDPAWRAGGALAAMPREAVEPVLTVLFDLAASEDDNIRGPAIEAMNAVGDAATPALPALINALVLGQHKQPVAEAAAVVLRNIGPPARAAAAQRLGDTGPMSPAIASAIRKLLASRVEAVRARAVRAAAIRGPVAVGASAVLARLARNDPSKDVREAAIDLVPECGLTPGEAVALLRRCLADDPEESSRRAASYAIGEVARLPGGRETAAAALPDLLARLGEDWTGQAEVTIARIGPAAVPGLIEVLCKGSDKARAKACEVLAALGEGALPAAGALRDALGSPDHETREQAAWALAALGPVAAPAVPALRRMMWADTEGQVKAAIAALVAAGATACFNDLARIAQGEDEELAPMALWGASRLGKRSQVVPLLQGSLASTSEAMRAVAAVELALIGAGPPPSIDHLFAACVVPALRDQLIDELVRRSDDPSVLSTAAETSRRDGHEVHSFGMEVLARVGGQDREAAVNALVSAFQCHDQIVLQGLGDHGAGSRTAFAKILNRMGSYNPAIRAAGVAALRKLLSPGT